MAVVQNALRGYKYIFEELSDPRTKDWWLISGPGPLLTILATYLYFCVKAGPQLMKHRKPYNLKYIVMVYNLAQIIINFYITYMGLVFVFVENYNIKVCHSVDNSNTVWANTWAAGVWLFFCIKLVELLDTVFFILRKKNKQVTFLHVYHHSIMPILTWLGVKYAPGGEAVPEGCINSFIHVIMYSYYFVAGLGPQYQKYLWWKKYLTSMQLIQFCIIVYMNTNCLLSSNTNYPKFLTALVMLNCVFFFYMFGQFYYNSYVKNKMKRE